MVNFYIINLIPKKKGADMIHLFRPICLLNAFLIFFTQVISIRFDPAIDKVILPCQNAFMKGRNIMDGVISLHEILQESRSKKQLEVDMYFTV
jgi:hypothetical protein